MKRPVDQYGRKKIKLDEKHNRPGEIVVDGDIYDAPVATIHFTISSEPADYVKSVATDVDFGTFQLRLEAAATVSGNVTLTKEQTEEMIAALQWQIGQEPS